MTIPAHRAHGGPDAHGVSAHDFSTNANACGPCPQALLSVQQADPTRYPDPAYGALRGMLAVRHGVEASRLVLAASASEFIFRITAWACGRGARRVWLPRHGFGDYASAAQAWGMERAQGLGDAHLAWSCDPSSPVGGADENLPAVAGSAAVVVLDRAYEPLRLRGSRALEGHNLNQLWQLWTPNKALGLTGVRAAYAIAPVRAEDDAAQLEALSPSWPIGTHGEAMLLAWCAAPVQQWLDNSLTTLRSWKIRQIALCEALGWRVLPGDANFFVCCAGDEAPGTGLALVQQLVRLRDHGVKLRDCASFGLPGHVRLSVQPPASQDALDYAWRRLA